MFNSCPQTVDNANHILIPKRHLSHFHKKQWTAGLQTPPQTVNSWVNQPRETQALEIYSKSLNIPKLLKVEEMKESLYQCDLKVREAVEAEEFLTLQQISGRQICNTVVPLSLENFLTVPQTNVQL